jgi:hypothetical protein
MRRVIFITMIVLAHCGLVDGQRLNRTAVHLSYNQIELSYGRHLGNMPFTPEVYMGLANQDINNEFDDLTGGVRLVFPVFSFPKSEIDASAEIGFYFPHNDFYNANAFTAGINLGYEKFLGQKQRHSLLLNLGYRYGKRSYKQEYRDEAILIATTDEFEVSPLCFCIGYCFRF